MNGWKSDCEARVNTRVDTGGVIEMVTTSSGDQSAGRNDAESENEGRH